MNDIANRMATTLLFLLIGSLVCGCGRGEPEQEAPVVRPVKMVELTAQPSDRRLEYPGRVSPVVQSIHSFEVPGRISDFPVREGQWLSAGELIARLDDRDYRSQLASSQARLDSALADYDRFKSLFDKGAVSQRDVESRRRNYEVASSNLDIAEKALEDTELRAHFEGRVARKIADDFQNVQAKEPVALLQDDRYLEIKTDVPERVLATDMEEIELDTLTSRLEPLVSITAIPGRTFPAKIKEAATAANPTTRTFEVTFSFEPTGNVRILPGMTARITVKQPAWEGGSRRGFVIPSSAAAIDDQGQSFVWRVDRESMQVEAVLVEPGAVKGSQLTVYGGLFDGDLIATSGMQHLREGMQVRRISEDG